MKIVVFEAEPWESEAFEALRDEHEVVVVRAALDEENASEYADAEVISTFIYSTLSRELLEQFGELKLIATRSTGVDHIARDLCEERGIRVANVPSYGKNTVAEHAMGLLLAVSHKIIEGADRTRRGDFTARGIQGFDLYGKTLGVVGTGDIGRHMAKIGRGFGMEVIAFDVVHNDEAAEEIGYEYVELEELLERSDVVSLHVPGNEKTEGMIGEEEFGRMKQGAVLINTARGSVVDMQAMARALADGKLSGAGLDVLPEEPVIREEAELLRSIYEERHDLSCLLADHVLTRMGNVVVTPHSAFNTREAVERILETTVGNIRSFVEGKVEEMELVG